VVPSRFIDVCLAMSVRAFVSPTSHSFEGLTGAPEFYCRPDVQLLQCCTCACTVAVKTSTKHSGRPDAILLKLSREARDRCCIRTTFNNLNLQRP
jgi:hypothetical protein